MRMSYPGCDVPAAAAAERADYPCATLKQGPDRQVATLSTAKRAFTAGRMLFRCSIHRVWFLTGAPR